MLAVDLEALVPVHPHGDGQVQMTVGPTRKLAIDEPRIRPELDQPRLHGDDLPAEKGGVDQMAAMTVQKSIAGGRLLGCPPAVSMQRW